MAGVDWVFFSPGKVARRSWWSILLNVFLVVGFTCWSFHTMDHFAGQVFYLCGDVMQVILTGIRERIVRWPATALQQDAAWIQRSTHDHAGCKPLLIIKRHNHSNTSSSFHDFIHNQLIPCHSLNNAPNPPFRLFPFPLHPTQLNPPNRPIAQSPPTPPPEKSN